MQTEERFKDIGAWLAEADSHVKLRRYDQAAPLYAKALSALKESRPEGHADILFCLQNLGDSLAFSGSSQKSLDTYLELHALRERQPGSNNADLVAAKYKVAKMLEMLGKQAESEAMLDEAAKLGEQSLYAGHPLLNAVYEAQVGLFHRMKAPPAKGAAVSQKLAAGVSTTDKALGGSMLDSLRLGEFTHLKIPSPESLQPKPPVEAEALSAEEPSPELKFELPPNLIRNLVICIVVFAAGVGGFYTFQQHNQQQQVKKEQAVQKTVLNTYAGKEYESADGQDKLTFKEDGKVEVVWDGVKQTAHLIVLPPESPFSAGGNIGHAVGFKQIPDAMKCDDNETLYDKSSSMHAVLERTMIVAAAAKEYFNEHKEYPETAKEIEDVNPAVKDNPLTHEQDEISVQSAGKERDWTAQDTPSGADSLSEGQLLEGEPPLAPGAVHCYYFEAGDKYLEGVKRMGFFIRVCGPDGKFLPSKSKGKVFVGEMIGANPPQVAGLYVAREATAEDRKIDTVKVISAK